MNKPAKTILQRWWLPGLLAVIAIAAVFFFINRLGSENAPTQVLTGNSPAVSTAGEISVEQAHERFQAGAFVLDVRTPQEWNEFHIDGTTLIPLNELAQRVNEAPKDREIVVVCRSGNRSQEGRDILLNAGFENVASMAGGVTEWRAAGYPTVSGP